MPYARDGLWVSTEVKQVFAKGFSALGGVKYDSKTGAPITKMPCPFGCMSAAQAPRLTASKSVSSEVCTVVNLCLRLAHTLRPGLLSMGPTCSRQDVRTLLNWRELCAQILTQMQCAENAYRLDQIGTELLPWCQVRRDAKGANTQLCDSENAFAR